MERGKKEMSPWFPHPIIQTAKHNQNGTRALFLAHSMGPFCLADTQRIVLCAWKWTGKVWAWTLKKKEETSPWQENGHAVRLFNFPPYLLCPWRKRGKRGTWFRCMMNLCIGNGVSQCKSLWKIVTGSGSERRLWWMYRWMTGGVFCLNKIFSPLFPHFYAIFIAMQCLFFLLQGGSKIGKQSRFVFFLMVILNSVASFCLIELQHAVSQTEDVDMFVAFLLLVCLMLFVRSSIVFNLFW